MTDILRSFPELGRYADAAICLPLAERVPATPRVTELLDMPLLQRLRGLRQLSLAHFVYPDATHTRFGHSLGVFVRCGRLLTGIYSRSENQEFREEIGPPEMSAVLVAALIHDAGHYPMAHSFEELIPGGTAAKVLKHDAVLVRMLMGQLPSVVDKEQLDRLDDTLRKWSGITRRDVLAILTGHNSHAETINRKPEVIRVLHSLLDGPFDADKLDYVQRDALHTGNPAGRAVDEERLVDSVIIRSFVKGAGVAESGLHAAQSLHFARATMFNTVYWHRTNRAANRMFTEALTLLSAHAARTIDDAFENDLFKLDDEAALRFVDAALDRAEPEAAKRLILPIRSAVGDRRNIYRRLVTIAATPGTVGGRNPSQKDYLGRICQKYDSYVASSGSRDAQPWLAFTKAVKDVVMGMVRCEPFEVLLDVPDARFETSVHDDPNTELGKSAFWVFTDVGELPVREKDPMFAAVLENWRVNARKFRLLVSPRVHTQLMGKEKTVSGAIVELASA